MKASASTNDKLSELERELDSLKSTYEQYFSGIVKFQPLQEHEDLKRKFLRFPAAELKSTSDKFKYTNIKARYHQLEGLWNKITKQIEEGTYVREKLLNKIKVEEPKEEPISSATQIINKHEKAIESLYKSLSQAKKDKKVMAKDKFVDVMKKQIQVYQKKHPGQSFQFRLAKDKKGQLQVKIEAKKK
jgi:hypothetical protein